jgi:hypothetical protein
LEVNIKNMIEPFKDYGDFVNHKNERIICFNVSRTYLGCERPNLYEYTRKYWRLNGQRAKKADLVFAICCGYIVGIFKPHHWFPTQCEKYKGRWEFEGEQIFDSPYQNQDISKIVRNRQNPVMYINM